MEAPYPEEILGPSQRAVPPPKVNDPASRYRPHTRKQGKVPGRGTIHVQGLPQQKGLPRGEEVHETTPLCRQPEDLEVLQKAQTCRLPASIPYNTEPWKEGLHRGPRSQEIDPLYPRVPLNLHPNAGISAARDPPSRVLSPQVDLPWGKEGHEEHGPPQEDRSSHPPSRRSAQVEPHPGDPPLLSLLSASVCSL